MPFRDTFWNVPGWAQVALYVGGAVALAVFAYGMWRRVQLWRAGGPEARVDRLPERVRLLAVHALGQARTLSQAYPGVMHAAMFWGFLALFMGTVLATIDWDVTLPLFGYKLLKGDFYLAYETVLDLFGLFFVIGLGMAVWRRFVVRPPRVDPAARFAWVLVLLFVINVTGFVMEACRLAVVQPPWAPWSPVGWGLGRVMLAAGMEEAALRATHLGVWLFHAVISLGFVAVVPYSYFVHMLTSPLNIFFARLTPRGEIRKIDDLEEAES
ncbi:MAG TPA: (Fe-S)-binding protein, partial [Methylomirabilota bacterium]|nr:(Fe-S)-binding protein [Methylomirabilota bacterium]